VFSSLLARDADRRALPRKNQQWLGRNNLSQAGIGIAMVTLIESAVRVTIKHSDSAPIASEAATVSVSRDEAAGAERPSNPAPGDPIMAEILQYADESPTSR
jgi:hypothetical protein